MVSNLRGMPSIVAFLIGCVGAATTADTHHPTRLTVTLAIPCIPRHIPFLSEVFADLRTQSLAPLEVVVAISGARSEDEVNIKDRFSAAFAGHTEAPGLVVVAVPETRHAADNRNTAFAASSGDIIR